MTGDRNDPALAYNFEVELVDAQSVGAFLSLTTGVPSKAGFSEVSGLEVSIEPEKYKEGGNNGTELVFPGAASWSTLKLRRGVVKNSDLWDWHIGFIEGRGVRRDGVVTLLDQNRDAVRSWRFLNGLPVKWLGPNFNAMEAAVAIEEIEIAHEGITGTGSPNLVSAIGALF